MKPPPACFLLHMSLCIFCFYRAVILALGIFAEALGVINSPSGQGFYLIARDGFAAIVLLLYSGFVFPKCDRRLSHVPTLVPWLGHGIRFSRDSVNFLKDCRSKYGPTFKFLTGGRHVIAISHPVTISNMLWDRNNAFGPFEFQLLEHFSGFTDHSRLSFIHGVVLRKAMGISASSLSPRNLGGIAAKFNLELFELLKNNVLPQEGNSVQRISVANFVRRNLFFSTSGTLLGPHFLQEHSYRDLTVFDTKIPQLILMKGLPLGRLKGLRLGTGEVEAVRERHIQDFMEFVDRNWREEDGGYLDGAKESYISNIVKMMKENGLTSEETARCLHFVMWGTHSNLTQICIWLFYHLIHDRKMFHSLQAEAYRSFQEEFLEISILLQATPKRLETSFPLLTSAIRECLRLYLLPTSLRVALSDVLILDEHGQGIPIRKGNLVMADVLNMHYNPIYFQDPETFKFDRFRENCEENSNKKTGFLPFADGPHRCAGQYYAMHSMRMFILLSFYLFEINPDAEVISLPSVDRSSFLSVMRPQDDRFVTLRRRRANM